eukprot:4807824-Pyramimonas_sp.AAC.1
MELFLASPCLSSVFGGGRLAQPAQPEVPAVAQKKLAPQQSRKVDCRWCHARPLVFCSHSRGEPFDRRLVDASGRITSAGAFSTSACVSRCCRSVHSKRSSTC